MSEVVRIATKAMRIMLREKMIPNSSLFLFLAVPVRGCRFSGTLAPILSMQ